MSDKRQLLLDAAIELIAEHGLAACTQPQVARRAQLRQSHLTYYFPTRVALLSAVADESVARRLAAFVAIEGEPTLIAKVDRLAALLTDPAQTRVLLALVQIADQDDAVRAAFDALRVGALRLGHDVLTSAGLQFDPVVGAVLQSASTGIAVLSLANGGEDAHERAVAMIHAMLTTAARIEQGAS